MAVKATKKKGGWSSQGSSHNRSGCSCPRVEGHRRRHVCVMLALVDHGDGLWKIVRRERVIVQASMKWRAESCCPTHGAPPEPWPDTWTLVSIDTRTPSTRPTLVSIDTPPTLLRHSSDTLRHSKPAIQTVEMRASCLSSVNCVKLRHSDTSDTADTPDTPTLDTPTRSDTTHAAVPGHRSCGPRT